MMIKNVIRAFLILSICVTGSCKNNHEDKNAELTKDIYTCSMHPQVRENHPGNCPICGMQLIKKSAKPVDSGNIELETLLKPANESEISTLPVINPQISSINVPVKAFGLIEYDTRAAGTISSRVAGRIEKMYIRYRFQPVSIGQKIMDIYSPELLTAQQNLLFLLNNDAHNDSFIQAAKEKLLLLGMSQKELEQVINSGKALMTVGVYSTYEGHVHDAGMIHDDGSSSEMKSGAALTNELSLREGMYVVKGQTLLMIMNHHKAWAALEIYPSDQSLVKVGNAVNIIPETDTNAIIKGQIDFIEPFFRIGSKTMTARVYFHNISMLPIGSHVRASILVSHRSALWLPASAVLTLGINQVVFLKKEDGFIVHKISTGIKSEDRIQIISGLSEKDSVIANAGYLIDSESLIKMTAK